MIAKMNKKYIVALLFVVLALVLFFKRQKSMVYNCSFAETRQIVFAYLDISEGNYSTETSSTILLSTNAPITGLIGFGFHTSVDDTPKKLSIVGENEFNILAYGSATIRFKVKSAGETRTRVTVDYSEFWWSMLPPFIYWELGVTKESRILESLNSLIQEKQEHTNHVRRSP